jgi:large subunit ribosomal protein L1
MDVAKAIADTKAGKVEYRLDKANIIHVPVGKASFETAKLQENLSALMSAIVKARPATLKGTYMKSATLTSTMGPGVKLDTVQFGA